MKTGKTLFSEALADVKAIKDAAEADATLKMQELIGPKLKAILESALAEEMEDDDKEEEETPAKEPKDESVLEKLQGLGLDETTLAKLTAALEGKEEEPKEDEEVPKEDETPEEVDETLDIDAALAEVEATFEAKEEPKDDDDDADADADDSLDEGGLSEEEINKILSEMEDDEDDDKEEEETPAKLEDPKEATILELQTQLAEATKVIKSQKEVILEVNTLNAKVTYLSKFLIKESLNDEQKARIVTSFNKVKTAGEAKTLYEAFDTKLTKQKPINESLGFNKAGKTVIKESKETVWSTEALEMQRRAGIIK